MIKRDRYLEELKKSIGNQMIKVITGPRRCGKSYLLFEIFADYLRKQGVADDHIVSLALDRKENLRYRDLDELSDYFDQRKTHDGKTQFFLIDEIQLCPPKENPWVKGQMVTFYDVLNQFLGYRDTEIFVTGSNSHLLSSDIATEFRGRGWQIHMHPLSYSEFSSAHLGEGDDLSLWEQYYLYGGLPLVSLTPGIPDKRKYLEEVYHATYLKDIVERHSLKGDQVIGEVARYLASTVGSPANPSRIANALASKEGIKVSQPTVKLYADYLKDAFLISEAGQFNLRGKESFGAGAKYYFDDLGLRNAATGFADFDQEPHYMENVIYNELVLRGYTVHTGRVADFTHDGSGKTERRSYEVDFVADRGGKRVYIQSALYIPDKDKMDQERRPLLLIGDSFRKVLITKISGSGLYDEDGILHLNLFHFLKDENPLQD